MLVVQTHDSSTDRGKELTGVFSSRGTSKVWGKTISSPWDRDLLAPVGAELH